MAHEGMTSTADCRRCGGGHRPCRAPVQRRSSMIHRIVALAYGLFAYVLFLGVFVYTCGFVGNLGTPTALDGELKGSLLTALLVNLGLVALFALQHSVIARPAFKSWWTKIVPEPVERSTYVLFASLALALLFWQWRPMGGVVWH